MNATADQNKELAKRLLELAFIKKDVNAAAELITDEYIQHNPNVPTGKAGFLEAIPHFYQMFPDLKWELKHIWSEGDHVIAHSHYHFVKEGNGSAVVDIFRIKDGKVDEHWDVIQDIPEKMAHNNGMF
ncbi:MAG TPA: nuclear transport factor 2 family protein [Chitinophagales bacterium]|nr:nuclear transport factor 2 family protein [Chitinophagales bacterium]